MVDYPLPTDFVQSLTQLARPLHARNAWRLLPLVTGMLFAQGRRTVASWLRAGELGQDYRRYYAFLGSLGRRVEWLACVLLRLVASVVVPRDRILLALDDTPTQRYGPQVEGAGLHHNPTPGPADQKFLYGHLWVTLAWVVRHPLWGAVGLPLRAFLYVRQKDSRFVTRWYKVPFRTKLQQAALLLSWAATWLHRLGRPLWVVVDGAYAKRPFLRPAQQAGATVVSRLRKDAALHSVPVPPRPGARRPRGRPRTYGTQRLSLAKRAAHRHGWHTQEFLLYGATMSKTFKTFLATYKPAGGVIRVVLVQERDGWVAYFCTAPDATVAQILEAVADRAAIEQDFHDLKEVHGAGQQQVRNYWANVAVYHLNLWLHTLIELWAWARSHGRLCDRRPRPWDDPDRRPSHADRRNALRRECLRGEFQRVQRRRPLSRKTQTLFRSLLNLIAW